MNTLISLFPTKRTPGSNLPVTPKNSDQARLPPPQLQGRLLNRNPTSNTCDSGPTDAAEAGPKPAARLTSKRDLVNFAVLNGAATLTTMGALASFGASGEVQVIAALVVGVGAILLNQRKHDKAPYAKLLSLHRDASGESLSVHLDNFIKLRNLPDNHFALATSLLRDSKLVLRETLSKWEDGPNQTIKHIVFSSHLFVEKTEDGTANFRDPTGLCQRLGGTALPVTKYSAGNEASAAVLELLTAFYKFMRDESSIPIDGKTTKGIIDDAAKTLKRGLPGVTERLKSFWKQEQYLRNNLTSGFVLDVSTPEKRAHLLEQLTPPNKL